MTTIRNKTDWEKVRIEHDIYREMIEEFSERLAWEIDALDDGLMAKRPGPGLNPIGYIYFHILRSWERDINHLIKEQPQAADGWHRLGLVETTGFNPDRTGYRGHANGTSYTDEMVDALPKGKAYLRRYHDLLFAETVAYLDAIDDDWAEFSRPIHHPDSPFNPFTPRWRLQHLISHGGRHLGEIQFVKGMLGLPDRTYPGGVPE